MASRILYLVRHGQYHMDPTLNSYGGLTALGRRQARRVAKRLAQYPIDVMHHSDMLRAHQTADLIALRFADLKMRKSPLLREGLPGFRGERPTARTRATQQRMDSAFHKYFRPTRGRDRHELVVCHGNIIRYLCMRVLDVPPGTWWRMDTLQCGLTVVRITGPDDRFLETYNDVGHLPPAMHTFL